jgi:lipopolysaccharide biosynthesis glycosyltransferase
MFAYKLTNYEKICIVESDLVIMSKIDNIFRLNCPSILYYKADDKDLNKNERYSITKTLLLQTCKSDSWFNGGVMLIKPSLTTFETYIESVPIIVDNECKYPNEALFGLINYNKFYNLPIKYNLSHYQSLKLSQYGMNPDGSDVIIYHFNETEYKHLNIIKENWLDENKSNPTIMAKYRVKKIPIIHFQKRFYEPHKNIVNEIMSNLGNPKLEKRLETSILNTDKKVESMLDVVEPLKSKSSKSNSLKSNSLKSNSSKSNSSKSSNQSSLEINNISWKLLDKYFTQDPNYLVRHHLDSYNDFFEKGIFNIFKENNPIKFIEREDNITKDNKVSEIII